MQTIQQNNISKVNYSAINNKTIIGMQRNQEGKQEKGGGDIFIKHIYIYIQRTKLKRPINCKVEKRSK